MRQGLIRKGIATAVATVALLGGAAITAPSASAVTTAKCNLDEPDKDYYKIDTDRVNFRKGPGTGYTSLGLLTKGTKFTYYCTKTYPEVWWYGKVTSGPHKGQTGWVYADYVTY
ncbi:SH3 domain-containing protein [Streptomyces sp. NPDC008222]|uniref:SH3 domain-containing protein n=1 Tax=Streptomyces sp. NPDC008222 TaxID=3364820 RepID=UPI0036DFCA89